MQEEEKLTTQIQPLSRILAQTIKTGIIKSNLIPMFAGLTLSLYTYQFGLLEKWPEIILAFIGSSLVMWQQGLLIIYMTETSIRSWKEPKADQLLQEKLSPNKYYGSGSSCLYLGL